MRASASAAVVRAPLDHGHQAGAVAASAAALGRGGGDGEDRALDRAHDRLAGQLRGLASASASSSGPHAGVLRRMRSLMPRSSWDRITPELPRAPMSEPWPMAWQHLGQPGARLDALELADHGLEREHHVGPGVPVGHRKDVQAVDVLLVEPQGVPDSPPSPAPGRRAERRRGGHGRGC